MKRTSLLLLNVYCVIAILQYNKYIAKMDTVSGKLPSGRFSPIKFPPIKVPTKKFPPEIFSPMLLNIPTTGSLVFLFFHYYAVIIDIT